MVTMTEPEAQCQLDEILDSVAREPVAITRNGLPIAFIISPRDMEDFVSVPKAEEREKA